MKVEQRQPGDTFPEGGFKISRLDDESAAPKPGSSRAYWLCQLLGWGGYGIGYYLAILVPFHMQGLKQIAADSAYCVAGLAGTHLLRLRMKSGGWSELRYTQVIPRLIAGALVVGTLQAMVLDSTLTVEGLMDWSRPGVDIAVPIATAFSSAFLVGLWLAVYWGIQSARRRRSAELRALRAQMLAREAQLRLLQQQLNPHFLFNCLNDLRGMIDEDAKRAQEMVTRLAELLRYSLRSDDSGRVSLGEELAIVDAYLDLESVRFEERLQIKREIDSTAKTALFPPMLLQGLVENALKHGIGRIPAGGEVSLRIKHEGDLLRVEVTNSGTIQSGGIDGIGMANARERLQLLYGERACLSLVEEPAGHVRAVLEIPFLTREAICEPSS